MDELNEQKLGKLLRLKKHETPGKEYFDAFLTEFHRYQRAEMFRRASRWEPLLMWFRENFLWEPRRLAFTVGGSFALVSLLLMTGVLGGSSFRVEKNTVAARAVPASETKVRLVSDSGAADEQSVPRYSTGQTPLTYDKTIAF